MNELRYYNKINIKYCKPKFIIGETSITLNVDCLKILGSPKFVSFYISSANQAIIIKPSNVLDIYKLDVPTCEKDLTIECPNFVEKIKNLSRRFRKQKYTVSYNSEKLYILIK